MRIQANHSFSRVHPCAPRLRKYYGAVAIHQDSILEMQPHPSRQYNPFQILAFTNQVFDIVAVGNAYNILLDDGPASKFSVT